MVRRRAQARPNASLSTRKAKHGKKKAKSHHHTTQWPGNYDPSLEFELMRPQRQEQAIPQAVLDLLQHALRDPKAQLPKEAEGWLDYLMRMAKDWGPKLLQLLPELAQLAA